MAEKNVKIWIWLHNNKLYKAVSNPTDKTFTIYDEHDNVLIKRTGLTIAQIKKIEITISTYGGKQVDGNKQPFTFL